MNAIAALRVGAAPGLPAGADYEGLEPLPEQAPSRLAPQAATLRLKARLLAFGGYLALALALTVSAWEDPTRRWVGQPGDPMKFIGFLAWYPFALGHGLNPLLDTYVNLPRGSNMMWDTTVPLVATALWPLTTLFGPVLSYNVAVSVALALDGWCSYLWLGRHVKSPWAAWTAGATVLFSPYVSARLQGHLNLLYFFPVLLIAREVEKLLAPGGLERWRQRAAWLGVLALVELLCSEEVLTLAVVVGATVSVALVLKNRQWAKRNAVVLAKVALLAGAVFCLGAAVPVGFQLLGPGRVVGPVQPTNFYVTDLENFFLPGAFSALRPHFATVVASHWTGDAIEDDGYVGAPLAALAVAIVLRFRRDPWVRALGLVTVGAAIWSLGPYLHVGGQAYQALPLPGRLLEALPLADNVLPARFSLFVDLGLAGLLAVFLDRVVFEAHSQWRRAGAVALVAACAPLVPQFPVTATGPATPRYFLPGGDVKTLRRGAVALVVPYGDDEETMAPMLWQAMAGFRFRMVSGAMINAGWHGYAAFGNATTGRLAAYLNCTMAALQAGGLPCGEHPVLVAREELERLGVSVIIMGPTSWRGKVVPHGRMENFLCSVAGRQPSYQQGVLVWRYGPRRLRRGGAQG